MRVPLSQQEIRQRASSAVVLTPVIPTKTVSAAGTPSLVGRDNLYSIPPLVGEPIAAAAVAHITRHARPYVCGYF